MDVSNTQTQAASIASEPTFEVLGGQGHRVLRRGLTRAEAEAYKRKFDRDCAGYGLNNPPTWIKPDGGSKPVQGASDV